MREICLSGSEGGVAQTNAPSLPLSLLLHWPSHWPILTPQVWVQIVIQRSPWQCHPGRYVRITAAGNVSEFKMRVLKGRNP